MAAGILISIVDTYGPTPAGSHVIICQMDTGVSINGAPLGRPTEQLENEYMCFYDGYGNEHVRMDAISLGI